MIADALRNAGIKYRDIRPGTQRLRCPKCDRKKTDTALSLSIRHDCAVWHCFRCGWSGGTRGGETLQIPVTRKQSDCVDRVEIEARAARKAAVIWNAAQPVDSHPYLARKGIGAF